jgi:hypothetical protein
MAMVRKLNTILFIEKGQMECLRRYGSIIGLGNFRVFLQRTIHQVITFRWITFSFLWPFSGMFSAANVLVRFPDLKKEYSSYLDTLTAGVWAYRDTIRSPVGYQAYPALLEKADRYYDDNALVCIDYLEAYLNTKDQAYIAKAKEVFGFIGWRVIKIKSLPVAMVWLPLPH